MHGYLKDEKTSHLLFIGLWIIYMVICLSKNTYSAAIASIVDEGLFDKSAAGIINAAFYLIYGLAQLFLSRLTDKCAPWRMLFLGILGALAANTVMAVTRSFSVMLIAWSVNGLLQFAVWPSTLNIIATVLHKEHRQKAAVYISVCLATGAVSSYFAAMLLLRRFSWASLFWFSAILLVLSLLLWIYVTAKMKKKLVFDYEEKAKPAETKEGEKAPLFRLLVVSGFLIFLIPAIGRCMLDQGVKSWVPTMMMESYGITAGTSSFIAMLVTLVNVFGVFLAVRVQRKLKNNPVTASAAFFIASVPMFALLLLIGKMPIFFVVVLLVTSTTAMYGINQLMVVDVPTAFRKYNCIGTVSSIINAFASFGVMLGNFGYGFLAEHFGWNAVIITWIVISSLSALCCFLVLPFWKRFTKS